MNKKIIYYSPKEVRNILSIPEGTLRRWAIALENTGYSFNRNSQEHRVFNESDLLLLKQFQALVQTQNMSLQEAATFAVLSKSGGNCFDPIEKDENELLQFLIEEYKITNDYLTKQLKEQQLFRESMLDQLEQYQRSVTERLNKIEYRQNEQTLKLTEALAAIKEVQQFLLEEKETKKSSKLLNFF